MIAGDIFPLHKMISKITQLLLVLSLFPLRRFLKLSWAEIGFAPKRIFIQQMLWGLGLGVLTLLPVLGLLYGLGVHVIDETRIWSVGLILKKIGISLFFAVLISYIEEPLFRGVLLAGLRQKITVWAAILISSLYYGSLHFLNSKTDIAYQDITLNSVFMLVGEAIANCFNPIVFSAFVGLLMVGIFLAVIRTQIENSLGLCIGFHASWVWQIKMSKDFLNINYQSPYLYLVSNYDGIVGFLIAGWLLLATLVFLGYQYQQKRLFK
jgi:membrane protease YdiL (CAAX protease family)